MSSQPEILRIDDTLRLRRFDEICPESRVWYSDPETVWLVDGVREPYDEEKLSRMYTYLDRHYELYWIELDDGRGFRPIGDVAFGEDDLPIVIGDPDCRRRGIGKKVVKRLIERGRELGYGSLRVREIYDWNKASRALFESCGFREYEKTEKGSGYRLELRKEANNMPTAIVTGASRGIGRGISTLLASKGYKIIAVGTREPDDVSEYIDELKKLSPESVYVAADISKPECRAAIFETAEREGGFDILVNNAGCAPLVRQDLLEMTEESLDRLLSINLKGTFFMCQTAAKYLIARKSDAHRMIINITSISAETSSLNRGEYCISKAGLSMVTKLFADKLAGEGVNVYELRPGIIETDMTACVKDKYEKLIDGGLLPIKRMGKPEDIAKAVLALCEGYFAYTTGSVMNIDGGFTLSRL
ncbi:MAG: 3-ketoacyl-ACP reductase [Candidatus Flemingiibacterium sp.]